MPKKRFDPFAAVRVIVSQLSHLTHDELRDLADMLIADAVTDMRDMPHRHGLPPVDPDRGHTLILFGGWQYRDNPPRQTEPARVQLRQAYESTEHLPPEARALVADVARQLQYAMAPVAERRTSPTGKPLAHGNIEAKTITRKVYNTDGTFEKKTFGSYLYYRYWATGGDGNRRGKRLKNKYIGKPALAIVFEETEPGSDERRELERRIIQAFEAGALDTLMQDLGIAPDDGGGALRDNPELPNTAQ